MAWGKGNRGSNHVEHQNSAQTHETLRNLPTYDCKTNGHSSTIKGPNGDNQCRACGQPV